MHSARVGKFVCGQALRHGIGRGQANNVRAVALVRIANRHERMLLPVPALPSISLTRLASVVCAKAAC